MILNTGIGEALGLRGSATMLHIYVMVLSLVALLLANVTGEDYGEWHASLGDSPDSPYRPECEHVPKTNEVFDLVGTFLLLALLFIVAHRMNAAICLRALQTFDAAVVLYGSMQIISAVYHDRLFCYSAGGSNNMIFLINFFIIVLFYFLLISCLDSMRATPKVKLVFYGLIVVWFGAQFWSSRAFSDRAKEEMKDVVAKNHAERPKTVVIKGDIFDTTPRKQYALGCFKMSVMAFKHLLSMARGLTFASIQAHYALVWVEKKTGMELSDVAMLELRKNWKQGRNSKVVPGGVALVDSQEIEEEKSIWEQSLNYNHSSGNQ